MYKLIIFDLDGTLLDTVADLATATNQALEACGFPTHEEKAYRFFVGGGIMKLFERALPENARTPETLLRIRELFLPYYERHNADLTKPYPGITELLEELQNRRITMAVASNKYDEATKKLVSRYFPGISFASVLGNREGIPVKPDPSIVGEICELTNAEPKEVLFVGDSGVDMQTAANAGVDSAGVTWGFRPREELEQYTPSYIVESPSEIFKLI